MTDKITLTNLVNLQNETTAVNAINTNSNIITLAIDNTLSRDGTSPNQMGATLDMNSNHIINLPAPASANEPLRLTDANTLNGGGTITISQLPVAGATGQVLEKNSATNFDVSWQNPIATGGTTGQVLVKNSGTNFDTAWNSSNVPTGGTTGQFLVKNSGTNFDSKWTTASLTLAGGNGISITGSGPTTIGLRDYLSVKDFGALGNGVNDDTSAIQAAITAAAGGAAAHTPITVFFPNGNYKITSSLVIPSTTGVIALWGESNRLGTTITSSSGVNGLLYQATNFGSLDMRNITWTTPNAIGVVLGNTSVNVTQCTIDNCAFVTCNTGISVLNLSGSRISHCFFNQFVNSAIQISCPVNPDGGDNWINNNYFINVSGLSGTGICVAHASGGGWKITNNKMLTCAYGIQCSEVLAGGGTSDLHIEDNSIEGMTLYAVYIQNTSGTSGGFSNIIVSGNEIGGGLGGSGVFSNATGGRKWITTFLIANNIIRTTSGVNAINVDGVLNSLNIVGNCIDDANANPSGFAIQVGANCSNGFISSNSITNYGANKVNNAGTNITAVNNGP